MKWLMSLYWKTRGVTSLNYRKKCSKCGYTGQAHTSMFIRGKFCSRFKE